MSIAKNQGNTYAYLIHCKSCYAAVIISPPRVGYDVILTEPCPMCNGLEQGFSCDYYLQKNTIYWDKVISQENNNRGILTESQRMNSQILSVIMIATPCGLATAVFDSAIIYGVSVQDNTTMSIIGNLTAANTTSSNITTGKVVTGGEGGNGSGTDLQ